MRDLFDREAEEATYKQVNALFAKHKDGPAAAYLVAPDAGGDRPFIYVTFVNGAVKAEHAEARRVHHKIDAVRDTIAAVAAQFPNHADEMVVWRIRPALEHYEAQAANPNLGLPAYPAGWTLRMRLVAIPLEKTRMTNVFDGRPDGRQSSDVAEPVSRFRPRYRALTEDEKALHDAIKAKAAELEALFESVKAGRYRSLGLTALEESVMWAVKELTS